MLPALPAHVVPRKPYRIVASDDASISEASRQIAQLSLPPSGNLGRRAHERVAYSKLIRMIPLDNDDLEPLATPIHVVGKHLATLGLDFFHREPIPQRFAIVSLETGLEKSVEFLIKINWCRFLKTGWYDSGGKFVKLVAWTDSDLDERSVVLPRSARR